MPIDLETLKSERDKLKQGLRELEAEQRKLEGELKNLRQQEVRAKREIEALTTLIEMNEMRNNNEEQTKPEQKPDEQATASAG